MRLLVTFIIFVCTVTNAKAQSVPDSLRDNPKVKITLETGAERSGYLIYDNDTEVKIWTREVGFLKIDKILIAKIEYLNSDKLLPQNDSPVDFSHFYALSNSGFSPGKGNMYVRLPYSICGILDYGITDDLTIGVNAYYIMGVSANLRYKIDFSEDSKLNFAVGSYYYYLNYSGRFNPFVTARASYTLGNTESNISLGGMYVTNFNRVELGLITVGGIKKISEKFSLLADIFVAPDTRSLNLDVNYAGLGFIGFRILTKKHRVWDIGIANLLIENGYYNFNGIYSLERFYAPIPYFQYTYKL